MVRGLMLLLVGALLGAVSFHLFYLRLTGHDRCLWDHPLDHQARTLCESAGLTEKAQGYAKRARQDLDQLIGKVAN